MAKNLTYFLDTLPDEFDSWNATYRQEYFTNELEGFDWLTNSTQFYAAAILTKQDLFDSYYFAASLMDDPGATSNATVTFFENVISGTVPSTTTEVAVCQETFLIDLLFVYWYLFPLISIVLLMSFFRKRKNLWPNILGGRPGVLYPINFIDEYERRWMYCAIFVLLAHRILYLFEGSFYFNPTMPKDVKFLHVFVVMLNVILLCSEFYPMLACVVMRRNVLANILGFILTLPWIIVVIFKYVICPLSKHDRSLGLVNDTYYNAVEEVLYEWVLIVALVACLFGYVYDLILNIRRFVNSRKKLDKSKTLIDTQEELCMIYIRELMIRKPPPNLKDLSFKERMKYRLRYVRMQGFKYPPRVVCTVLVGLFALYRTATTAVFEMWIASQYIKNIFTENEEIIREFFNSTKNVQLIMIYIRTTQWSIVTCLIVSFIIQVLLMVHFVSQYRKHIKKFFRGRHTWHHTYTSSPAGTLVRGMKYSGYQVAFLVFGYILVGIVLFVIVMLFAGFIVIPLATKTQNPLSRFFIDKFISLWPAIAVGLIIYYSQILMAKFVFLQERGAYVALNNRRLYHVICFFLFFFNAVIGIFSGLKRILYSVIFGTLLMSRLDRCLLMRGFERFDTGFGSYLGMLIVDVYHNHPIIKGFVHILKEEAKISNDAKAIVSKDKSEKSPENHRITAKKRVRNKYWKFVTLLNNPSLVLDRLHSDIADMKKANADGTMANVMDNIAGVTSLYFGNGVKDDLDEKNLIVTTQL